MDTIKNKISRTPKALSLVIATLLSGPLANAADEGWYAGASIGESQAGLNFNSAQLSTLPTGVTITNSRYDDSDIGFKIFGGYQLNSILAVEGGYFDLGEFGFNANTTPMGTSEGSFEVDGGYLDMVGTISLTSKLDFLARAGFNYANTDTQMRGTGAVPGNSPSLGGNDWNPKLGIGLQYELTDNFDLRLEAERYHLDEPVVNKGDVDLLSLGVVYRFGRKPAARSTPAPARVTPPAPVARAKPPAVTPAPVVTPPPAPQPVRVEFSADSLFDFDRSVVKDTGKPELDRFVADLSGVSFDIITVTGHTDRIGNRDYNLALSQRRADAVKNYLVQTGGLAAGKIKAVGVNGSNSLVGANECRNMQNKAAQIACLQPDRRVVVVVTATR